MQRVHNWKGEISQRQYEDALAFLRDTKRVIAVLEVMELEERHHKWLPFNGFFGSTDSIGNQLEVGKKNQYEEKSGYFQVMKLLRNAIQGYFPSREELSAVIALEDFIVYTLQDQLDHYSGNTFACIKDILSERGLLRQYYKGTPVEFRKVIRCLLASRLRKIRQKKKSWISSTSQGL